MMTRGQLPFIRPYDILRLCSLCVFLLLCFALAFNISCTGKERVENDIKIERENMMCNTREYLKKNIRFKARPIAGGDNYSNLLIGSPNCPYNGDPALVILLPSGTEVNLTEISTDQLKKQVSSVSSVGGYVFTDIGSDSLAAGSRWPAGTERLQIQSWVFFVHDDRILSFRVYYRSDRWKWAGQKPALRAASEAVFYEFPLNQKEVIRVFGKPDKIREYLEE